MVFKAIEMEILNFVKQNAIASSLIHFCLWVYFFLCVCVCVQAYLLWHMLVVCELRS